jgi:DivIVA domain-containing protein
MEWFIAAVAVVALGVAAVVAAGGGGSMAKDPVRDTYAMTVSEEPLDAAAVRGLRFGVALRGYAMDQVDAVLDRLALELAARDARVAELEARLGAPAETGEQQR